MNTEIKRRGPKVKQTDRQLMEIVLQIKNEIKHQIITPSLLEKKTGIGRNTWSRRIRAFIDEINQPVSRQLGLSEEDTIYFPNVESLVELFWDNKPRLIAELHKFELLLQDIYKENKSFKQEVSESKSYKTKIDDLYETIKKLRIQLNHYKNEYEKKIVSSLDPELRKQYDIHDNLIDFQKNSDDYSKLIDLKSHFPNLKLNLEPKHDIKPNNESLKGMFPNLFDN